MNSGTTWALTSAPADNWIAITNFQPGRHEVDARDGPHGIDQRHLYNGRADFNAYEYVLMARGAMTHAAGHLEAKIGMKNGDH
jgi:hypothetical protein